ncbi:hypothetical protein [Halocatena halophila]|uniref:hypothetical protein n=1 Tax=Halocatena halophila TaxID=2814576 RepID=UPI002ED17938
MGVFELKALLFDDNSKRIETIDGSIIDDERLFYVEAKNELTAEQWLLNSRNVRNISRVREVNPSSIPEEMEIETADGLKL